jgi:hypothetical protein
MKRTNAGLLSIAIVVAAIAVTAGPAGASVGYASSIGGNDTASQATKSQDVGLASINATLGAQPEPTAATDSASTFRSVNSIVGSRPVPEQTTTVVRASSGFDWGDAFIGALVAFGLVLISVMTVRELRRHGRVAAGSHA